MIVPHRLGIIRYDSILSHQAASVSRISLVNVMIMDAMSHFSTKTLRPRLSSLLDNAS